MFHSGEKNGSSSILSSNYFGFLSGLLLISLITAFFYLRPDTANHNDLGRSSQSGTEVFNKVKIDKSIPPLVEALKKDPQNAGNYKILGFRFEAVEQHARAYQAYESSIKINPNQPEVLYRMALMLNQGEKRDKAIAVLQKAISIDSNFFVARLMLGDLYLEAGKKELARQEYQKIIDINPFGNVLDQAKVKLESLKDSGG